MIPNRYYVRALIAVGLCFLLSVEVPLQATSTGMPAPARAPDFPDSDYENMTAEELIAEVLAQVKGVTADDVARATTANAQRLFRF